MSVVDSAVSHLPAALLAVSRKAKYIVARTLDASADDSLATCGNLCGCGGCRQLVVAKGLGPHRSRSARLSRCAAADRDIRPDATRGPRTLSTRAASRERAIGKPRAAARGIADGNCEAIHHRTPKSRNHQTSAWNSIVRSCIVSQEVECQPSCRPRDWNQAADCGASLRLAACGDDWPGDARALAEKNDHLAAVGDSIAAIGGRLSSSADIVPKRHRAPIGVPIVIERPSRRGAATRRNGRS